MTEQLASIRGTFRLVRFSSDQLLNVRRTKTHHFGAICTTPGNLCLYGTAWWGWEDSNLQPSGYRQEMGEVQSSHSTNLCSRRCRNYNAISMTYVFAVLF
jgi:hypothetical protein